MDIKPNDISPEMREFYKWLRGRPGMWIGKNEINNLNVFMNGMRCCADIFLKGNEAPVLIPEGFDEYVENYYGERMDFNSFSFVEYFEKDSKNAIDKWFELLDEYLVLLGYEPIPKVEYQ